MQSFVCTALSSKRERGFMPSLNPMVMWSPCWEHDNQNSCYWSQFYMIEDLPDISRDMWVLNKCLRRAYTGLTDTFDWQVAQIEWVDNPSGQSDDDVHRHRDLSSILMWEVLLTTCLDK